MLKKSLLYRSALYAAACITLGICLAHGAEDVASEQQEVVSKKSEGNGPTSGSPGQGAERPPLLGVFGGIPVPGGKLSNDSFEPGSWSLGARGTIPFAQRWSWFADILYSRIRPGDPDLPPVGTFPDFGSEVGFFQADHTVQAASVRTGAILDLGHSDRWRWFVSLGGGWTDVHRTELFIVDMDTSGERQEETVSAGYQRGFASVGFGQQTSRSGGPGMHWEVRADRSFGDSIQVESSLTTQILTLGSAPVLPEASVPSGNPTVGSVPTDALTLQLLFGVDWGLAKRHAAADADGDGVGDDRDRCPATPTGTKVDRDGCPRDGDADGVADDLDRCPDTPKGVGVGKDGCPRDGDADGVPDEMDRCPDTPKGMRVNRDGCPRDGDADGIPDEVDRCPGTPKGAKIDPDGCPRDGDADGVPDGLDRCPETPKGARVEADGCPRDGDADGVPDGLDRCPDTPPGTPIEADGCPRRLFKPGERAPKILEGVNFELDSAVLTPASSASLDRVAASLQAHPDLRVEIGGHTCSIGSADHNLDLSRRRAEAVRDYLVGKRIASSRLEVRAYGETRPIADNATEEGLRKNRRVELMPLE